MARYHVLIAEDEARMRNIIRDYFAAHGTDCDLARNGAEAVDLMRETYDGTISFRLAGEEREIRLIDLLSGQIYELPPSMMESVNGQVVRLRNLPLTDCPLLLTFGEFAPLKRE